MVFGGCIYFFVAWFANRRAQKHVANPMGITNKGREMNSMARIFIEQFFVHGRWSVVQSKFLRTNRLWTIDHGLSTKIHKPQTLFFALLIMLSASTLATAQPYQKDIKNGNAAFEKKAYDEAEVNYKKAADKNPESFEGWFNLGDALYKQKRFDEALAAYQKGAQFAGNKERAAAALHNIGNTFSAQKQYDKAVDAYKAALRLNPKDDETRYNLAKAMRELKQQQQQNKDKNDQNKDQKKDDKKDDKNQENQKDNPEKKDDPKNKQNNPQQEKEDDNAKKKQDQPKDKEPQNKEKKPGDGEQKDKGEQQPDGQPQQQKMNKEEMDRLLQTIANAEKQTRAKIDKKKKVKVKTTPGVKDW